MTAAKCLVFLMLFPFAPSPDSVAAVVKTGDVKKVDAKKGWILLSEQTDMEKTTVYEVEAGEAALSGYTIQSLKDRKVEVEIEQESENSWQLRRLVRFVFANDEVVSGTGTLETEIDPNSSTVTVACDETLPCRHGKVTLRIDNTANLASNEFPIGKGEDVVFGYAPAGVPKLEWLAPGDTPTEDDRPLQASAFYGIAVDSFAAQDLNRYLNPEDSGGPRERWVGGFDFDYRLTGGPDAKGNLYISGETIHGVRSTDVNCDDDPNLDICSGSTGSRTLAIVRSASSLEAYLGLRYEFGMLQKNSASPARLYVKAQAGFITVNGDDGDLLDLNHVGFGLIADRGRYSGSFLEVGYGTSQVFETYSHGRYKLDGFLTWRAPVFEPLGLYPFVEFFADVDLDTGPDTVQTYLGFDFDLDQLFGSATKWLKFPKRSSK